MNLFECLNMIHLLRKYAFKLLYYNKILLKMMLTETLEHVIQNLHIDHILGVFVVYLNFNRRWVG